MAKSKQAKIVSKKHQAREERERQQTMIITISAIGILVIVFGLIGYGILDQTVLQARQPIVNVDGSVLTTREFQVRVKVQRQQLINQYLQYQQLAQMFGIDPTTDQSLSSTFSNIQSQLDDPNTIGNQVIENFKNSVIIRKYAQDHGFVITAQDVEDAVRAALNYYPSGTPSPTPTETPYSTSTLSALQLQLVPPTATPTLAPTATASPTPVSSPTFTLTLAPTSAATLAPTSSPTPYTLQGYQSQYQKLYDMYKSLGLTDADFRTIFFEDNLYQKKVEDAVEANFSHTQEQVWARHILVADQATAEKVRYLLVTGGDWNELAKQYSTDTGTQNSGGDLGWFGRGKMVAEFEQAAFSLPVGEISQPVQSAYGYHIIQVLGHEDRPLSESDYTSARDQAFQTWLTDQLTNSKVKVYDYWINRVPTSPTLAEASNAQSETLTALPLQPAP